MEGKVFGKYTVLNRINIGKPGKRYECLCECGNIRIKAGTELRAGKATQCQECAYAMLYDPQKQIGLRFGRWTVTRFIGRYRKSQQFELTCECGNKGKNIIAELKKNKSTQCRDCGNKQASVTNSTHGMHKTKLYKVWSSMKSRCLSPGSSAYSDYGGRGIKICDRWLVFDNFYQDMGDRPMGMTIDRTDNDGNYEPSNCRWVTHKENCNNRRSKMLTHDGITQSIRKWAIHFETTYSRLYSYLKAHTIKEAAEYYKK